MADKVRVKVLKASGDNIVVAYSGNEPIEYKVKGGYVEVAAEHLDTFLAVVAGSKVTGGDHVAKGE